MNTTHTPCRICLVSPCHNVLHRVVAAADGPGRGGGGEHDAEAAEAQRQPDVAPDIVLGPPTPQPKALSTQGAKRLVRLSPYMVALRNLVDDHAIAAWAARYLATEVYGIQAHNTLEAKSRDLAGFVQWFVNCNGHGDMACWLPRDTQAYLNTLERLGRAPTTVNRVYATMRRFARWAHDQPGDAFGENGLPTRGVKMLVVEEPDCKKVSPKDVHQLFKAADVLVEMAKHPRARPRRDRALLALLYYTGLRVSEVVQLTCAQYKDGYLVNVARKGKARSKGVYVVAACRKLLEDYLAHERLKDDPKGEAEPLMLPAGSQTSMARQYVNQALQAIARQGSKHRGKLIHVHPHRLRHTFGAEYRDRSGSDTETAAALGHTGLQYVGRYVRKTDQERQDTLESMFSSRIP